MVEHQTSIGRWFKSGSKDFFCSTFLHALTGLTWHGQEESMELYPASGTDGFQSFLDSIVVSISACHVEGPGSIPGRGVLFLSLTHHHLDKEVRGRILKKTEFNRPRLNLRKKLAPRGIEPVTFALLARRSNQLS